MSGVSLTLSPDYWQTFSLNKKDIDFISTYLIENEVPLTETELVPILVDERISEERKAQLEKRKSDGKIYLPKNEYKAGDKSDGITSRRQPDTRNVQRHRCRIRGRESKDVRGGTGRPQA